MLEKVDFTKKNKWKDTIDIYDSAGDIEIDVNTNSEGNVCTFILNKSEVIDLVRQLAKFLKD